MFADSEFVTFLSHAIDLLVDLTVYPTVWAVLKILLETQDANAIYVCNLQEYHSACYKSKNKTYMWRLEREAAKPKDQMYSGNFVSISDYIKSRNPLQPQQNDQQEAEEEDTT